MDIPTEYANDSVEWNVSEIGQARVLRGYLQRRIVLEVPGADPNKRSCQGNTQSTLTPDWSSWSRYPLSNYRIAQN